ncbi:serine hydrolase domain-containing protein [Streptomyces sp. NPDC057638]|uniref:serine hydrolase domain-containing protein n=1 Tax=Streptomyces sp. NPDC057638 TaxID=3346190 RepID=UPI0036B9BD7A
MRCARWRGVCAALAVTASLIAPVAAGVAPVAAGPVAYAAPGTRTAGGVFAAADPSPLPSPSPSAEDGAFAELTPEVAARLDAAVRQVMRETGTPGVTVGLWAPEKGEYVRSFGVADKATDAPMDPGLFTRIGSVTKTFTVTALLELVDRGEVGLDDPIGQYVDGVPNGDRITLRELAGMRSGLFNYSEDDSFDKALTTDPEGYFSPQELLNFSFRHPVNFAPGAEFEYSNTNLILLGLVVEKVGGIPLDQFIERNVLEPAGLAHTSFPSGTEFPSPHAHGYTDQTASGAIEDSTGWNSSWAWAAGAMVSDLQDLRRWARILATGTLLEPATQAERLKTGPTPAPGVGYGLGVFAVHGWVGHNGSLPGYETVTMYLPQARATMVILLNTDVSHDGTEPSTLFATAVTEIVSPDHVYELPQSPTAPSRSPGPSAPSRSPAAP